jgi:hypothetical protein
MIKKLSLPKRKKKRRIIFMSVPNVRMLTTSLKLTSLKLWNLLKKTKNFKKKMKNNTNKTVPIQRSKPRLRKRLKLMNQKEVF